MNLPELPKFVMLNGPRDHCHAFAKELVERYKITQLTWMDLDDPIITEAIGIFYPNRMEINLDDPTAWRKNIPFENSHGNYYTFEQWISRAKRDFRAAMGKNILGRLFVSYYSYDAWMCPSMIIRDLDEPADVKFILNVYGHHCVAIVNLGPLDPTSVRNITGAKDVWIPDHDVKLQADRFITWVEKTYATVSV